jgi:hypothetical protein
MIWRVHGFPKQPLTAQDLALPCRLPSTSRASGSLRYMQKNGNKMFTFIKRPSHIYMMATSRATKVVAPTRVHTRSYEKNILACQ